jgi:hypothetical protein
VIKLVHGRWFSPGTPASSTTKTGRHDIAEILLKVALNTKNQSSIQHCVIFNLSIHCKSYCLQYNIVLFLTCPFIVKAIVFNTTFCYFLAHPFPTVML